jgi:hypothetical protein
MPAMMSVARAVTIAAPFAVTVIIFVMTITMAALAVLIGGADADQRSTTQNRGKRAGQNNFST